ncbi:MAG: Gfo/Idh/MocA family oxidoreductase [Clostridia bacterium]|nr:Gfo/Idh/MocA family oxidoreductase [Clostridia bacterium]
MEKKKIVILGCENSHADLFMQFMRKYPQRYQDIEVVGVYSDEKQPCESMQKEYGVHIMSSYDEMVGKVDGVINTARLGSNHYKYCKPYLASGVPMFVDKPIALDKEEALKFAKEAKEAGVKVTGGSCLIHDHFVKELKNDHLNNKDGKTHGGLVRAPSSSQSGYGNFWFYTQHFTEMVLEIFGRYPKSIKAFKTGEKDSIKEGDSVTVVFRYGDYDVTGIIGEYIWNYYVGRCSDNQVKGFNFEVGYERPCFQMEFDIFCDLLRGGEMTYSYNDFIAPIYSLSAIVESMNTGKEVFIEDFNV